MPDHSTLYGNKFTSLEVPLPQLIDTTRLAEEYAKFYVGGVRQAIEKIRRNSEYAI